MPTDRDSDVNQDQILSIDDVISKLEEEMDILADDISKNDYKINIGLEPHEGKRCLHVKVNAPDHIMDADPTDKETNSKLLTSWMERITKHILESFSDLDPITK